MTALLIVLGLGDLVSVVHYITHHRSGLLTAVAGLFVWAARRTHLTSIPLFAAEAGTRGAHGKTRRQLRKATKAARKAARKAAAA